jgi:hypothetical protein
MTSPELCSKEFTGEPWTVHCELLARLWDGDPIAAKYPAIARQLSGCERLLRAGHFRTAGGNADGFGASLHPGAARW